MATIPVERRNTVNLELSPAAVAGVLDALYRGATGVPRRFYLASIESRDHELREFAGRTRALRPDFFGQVGETLECVFEILMSQPRNPKEGVLGFASLNIVEKWPAVPEQALRTVLSEPSEGDGVQSTRKRLERLYEINHGDLQHLIPVVLTTKQLCELGGEKQFDNAWWLKILNYPTSGSKRRLMFFYSQIGPDYFAITRADYVTPRWHHPNAEDWAAALKRSALIEVDEDADLSRTTGGEVT
jgi:hypothetical protein